MFNTLTPMMECGHAANAQTGDGKPICVICVGISPGADIVVDVPDLTDREARCSCGALRPSDTKLAFFEYRGPGSKQAMDTCKNCGYAEIAHTQPATRTQQNVVENGKCSGFEARGGLEYDSFYDGCRGWD